MREEIFTAVVRRNEAVTFRVIEPFHGACCHIAVPYSLKKLPENCFRRLFEFQGRKRQETAEPVLRSSLKPNTFRLSRLFAGGSQVFVIKAPIARHFPSVLALENSAIMFKITVDCRLMDGGIQDGDS